MSINDGGHRPHGTHFGEHPRNELTEAPYNIRVRLDTWGPQRALFPVMYDMLQANWGDAPSRTVDAPMTASLRPDSWQVHTGWAALQPGQQAYVEKAFAGGTLPQVLELLTFSFSIDGVSRCFTHQNVRTRIGAAFMQHGGRDNDWRHRPVTMPETVRRLCIAVGSNPSDLGDLQSVLEIDGSDGPSPERGGRVMDILRQYCQTIGTVDVPDPLGAAIAEYLQRGRDLYAVLVDAGIPWQDARRFLWNGQETYIHDIYSYPALKSVLANRLEHIMDWEFNCVAQLMLREIKMKCPPLLSKYLGSHSDLAKRAMFAGLDSWPPDGKWPVPKPPCVQCGHAYANHPIVGCEVCEREGRTPHCAEYDAPHDVRTHHALQNPYFVLHPSAMAGGPIHWVPTNGTFPEECR